MLPSVLKGVQCNLNTAGPFSRVVLTKLDHPCTKRSAWDFMTEQAKKKRGEVYSLDVLNCAEVFGAGEMDLCPERC